MQIGVIRALADSAVTLELSDAVGPEASALVAATQAALERAMALGELEGVSEVASAFCSVTVHYDCLRIAQNDLVRRLTAILAPVTPAALSAGRSWQIPCCYSDELGLDLRDLEENLGLNRARIVEIHQQTSFHVYALGFLPGLPFLGDLPQALACPRRTEPRTRVPAGSVAIANGMCVIYPWNSPGGWHIVGRCPVPLFDIARKVPALFSAGDSIRFRSVGPEELADLDSDLRSGRRDALTFQGAS